MLIDNNNSKINYFPPGPYQEADRRVSAKITQHLQKEFKDVVIGIGCFQGLISLQVKTNKKPYQMPL